MSSVKSSITCFRLMPALSCILSPSVVRLRSGVLRKDAPTNIGFFRAVNRTGDDCFEGEASS